MSKIKKSYYYFILLLITCILFAGASGCAENASKVPDAQRPTVHYPNGINFENQDTNTVPATAATTTTPDVSLHPDGTLIKTQNSNSVFYIQNGKIRLFHSQSDMRSYGFSTSDVIVVTVDELKRYPRTADMKAKQRYPCGRDEDRRHESHDDHDRDEL